MTIEILCEQGGGDIIMINVSDRELSDPPINKLIEYAVLFNRHPFLAQEFKEAINNTFGEKVLKVLLLMIEAVDQNFSDQPLVNTVQLPPSDSAYPMPF